MGDIKFTSDGKKVKVLGNLNSQEKIVQEIFVIDNSEIPSGEHFVVKDLHDAPAVSWKEQRLKEIDEQYQREQTKYAKMCSEFNSKTESLRAKLEFIAGLDSKFEKGQLKKLIDYISGNIKYVLIMKYDSADIVSFDDALVYYDRGRYDGIKLLSLYGSTKGDITYKLNRWSDGSGSSSEIVCCRTMEEAIGELKLYVNKLMGAKGLSEGLINTMNKYNIEIPNSYMDVYIESQKEYLKNCIQETTKKLNDLNEKLKVL